MVVLLKRCLVWPGRLQPELNELGPRGRRRVPLVVLGAPAKPPLLHSAGGQDATVAEAVRVLQGAFHNVGHGLQVRMDVHWPGRTRREYAMMEAPQGADGRRPVCGPWPTGQVPTSQEAGTGINEDLSVATYLQGGLIDG